MGRAYFHDFSKKTVNFSLKISKAAFQNAHQRAGHIFMIFSKKLFPTKCEKRPFKMAANWQGIFFFEES
jgi:hypothetical protein